MSMFFLITSTILTLVSIALIVVILRKQESGNSAGIETKLTEYEKKMDSYENNLKDQFDRNRSEAAEIQRSARKENQDTLLTFQNSVNGKLDVLTKNTQDSMTTSLTKFMETISARLDSLTKSTQETLNLQKDSVQQTFKDIQSGNEQKLNQMRETVEKSQKSITENLTKFSDAISSKFEKLSKGGVECWPENNQKKKMP